MAASSPALPNTPSDSAPRYDRPLSIALVDVDNFKLVHDEYRHPVGIASSLTGIATDTVVSLRLSPEAMHQLNNLDLNCFRPSAVDTLVYYRLLQRRRAPWRYLFVTALLLFAAGCTTVPANRQLQATGYEQRALNADAITLVSWNIQKGAGEHWATLSQNAALRTRLAGADLLLFQEACAAIPRQASQAKPATAALTDLLARQGFGWSLSVGFESRLLGCGRTQANGVLTASRVQPIAEVALRSRHRELGITPKTAQATTFALRGSDAAQRTLLVINAHLLNFEWYRLNGVGDQLRQIGSEIARHEGPVIFAGDFNTRNAERQRQVDRFAARYGLRPVFGEAPAGRSESIFGGGYALDHVYYRGLRLLEPGVVGSEADQGLADHNSLTVRFALDASAYP